MATPKYEMSVGDLSRAVFLQNGNNGRILLDFPWGPADARGAFNFLLDLFLKGLVLLYGDEAGRLDVASLEPAAVAFAIDRMRYLGVEVRVITAPAATLASETEDDVREDAARVLHDAGRELACAAPCRLEDLSFTVRSLNTLLRISFRIRR